MDEKQEPVAKGKFALRVTRCLHFVRCLVLKEKNATLRKLDLCVSSGGKVTRHCLSASEERDNKQSFQTHMSQ